MKSKNGRIEYVSDDNLGANWKQKDRTWIDRKLLKARIANSRNHLQGSDQKDYIIGLGPPPEAIETIETQKAQLDPRIQEIENARNDITWKWNVERGDRESEIGACHTLEIETISNEDKYPWGMRQL